MRSFVTALAVLAASAAGATASANCEKPSRVHGGTPFLQRLAGSWHVTGSFNGRPLDRVLDARMEGETLRITLDQARTAPFDVLTVRYRPACDDYVATRSAGGTTTQGSGISRGDGLDMTFGPERGPRSDVAFEWDSRRGIWEIHFARQAHDFGAWERLGSAELRSRG